MDILNTYLVAFRDANRGFNDQAMITVLPQTKSSFTY